jgi:hypothetical protein
MGDKALNAALAEVCPVPPFAIATVPVTLAELPEILPVTCEPGKLKALKVVSVALVVAVMLAAVPVVFWLSVGTSATCMVFITTFVPLPRKYDPLVTAPAKAFIAA